MWAYSTDSIALTAFSRPIISPLFYRRHQNDEFSLLYARKAFYVCVVRQNFTVSDIVCFL
jgi:hypothetical protein